ncbi:uncharacterized protein LOC114530541 [Dendronephthya gigantea]|uniref:uncharacterized protein LOC114530541 n=1 Tax=Dendronephthya gigantea TaxID=151771 RepID=UPI0010695656|nr:uncharacterized protein LOC114530541 [Dendronephthya gigantea]
MHLKSVTSVVFFLFFFLGKATLSECQVPVVNRNDIDSFLVKGGCSDDPNVCPRSATCHSKTGLCLCDSRKPTYQNPEIITDGAIGLKHGASYGCVNNRFIDSYGSTFCPFSPFQSIPYTHNDKATEFSYLNDDPDVVLKSCSFKKAWAKFPGSSDEKEQLWLNESFVDIKVSRKSLCFKWRKSVKALQGTIITFNLRCDVGSSILELNCLRAKVVGTWISVEPSCTNVPWDSSFNVAGWSKCSSDKSFIKELYRSASSGSDKKSNLKSARCCTSIPVLDLKRKACKFVDWSTSLNRNNQWSLNCPSGYFLNGLHRTSGQNLSNIEKASCCRPEGHPDECGLCYDEDVTTSFNQAGWSGCSKAEGYYITGVYHDGGEDHLNNIDKFRCCQMARDRISVPTFTPTAEQKERNENLCSNDECSGLKAKFVAVLAVALFVIVVLGILVGFLWRKFKLQRKENTTMKEMQSAPEQAEANVQVLQVELNPEIQNSGVQQLVISPSSEQGYYNRGLTDQDDYEVPTFYQPLKIDPIRVAPHYQSLQKN